MSNRQPAQCSSTVHKILCFVERCARESCMPMVLMCGVFVSGLVFILHSAIRSRSQYQRVPAKACTLTGGRIDNPLDCGKPSRNQPQECKKLTCTKRPEPMDCNLSCAIREAPLKKSIQKVQRDVEDVIRDIDDFRDDFDDVMRVGKNMHTIEKKFHKVDKIEKDIENFKNEFEYVKNIEKSLNKVKTVEKDMRRIKRKVESLSRSSSRSSRKKNKNKKKKKKKKGSSESESESESESNKKKKDKTKEKEPKGKGKSSSSGKKRSRSPMEEIAPRLSLSSEKAKSLNKPKSKIQL